MMSKRFFVISLIVVGLLCSSFSFVVNSDTLTSINKDDFYLLKHVEKANINEDHILKVGFNSKVNIVAKDVSYKIIGNAENISEFNRCVDLSFMLHEFDFEFVGKVKEYGIYSVDIQPIVKGVNLHGVNRIGSWFNSSWNNKARLVIDHDQVPSDLVNFPVLLNFTDADLYGNTLDNGTDIIFTRDDECFMFNREIEYYNSGTGELIVWVNVTSISSTVDTYLWIYFNSANSVANSVDTWDSNYIMIQHMNDATTSTILDSTSNDNDGTKTGANEPIQTTGQIGYGQDFDGSDDSITKAVGNTGITNAFTIEAIWEKEINQVDTDTIIEIGTSGDRKNQIYITPTSADVLNFRLYNAGGTDYLKIYTGASSYTANNWYCSVLTWDGTYLKGYLSGAEDAPYLKVKDNAGALTNTNRAITIGNAIASGEGFFKGIIDEVRISDIARSADWLTTSYNTINNASTGDANPFISFTTTFLSNAYPVIENPNPANNSIDNILCFNWSINISDDWTNFNLTISSSNASHGTYSLNNQTNGTFYFDPSPEDCWECETNYTIYVNVTEWNWCTSDVGRTTHAIFYFTTESCKEPEPINISIGRYFSCYDWMSISGARAAGVNPAEIKLNGNGFVVAEFTNNQEEYIQANLKVPNMDFTKNCSICIGWSSPVVNKTCDWEITYIITEVNDNTDILGTTVQIYANSSNVTDGMVINNLVYFEVGNLTFDDVCVHIQIMRDGNDINDTINNIVEVHGIAFGYTCLDYIKEGDHMEINMEISQLVMLMLLGCWLFFTAKFYERKEIILAWVQFSFAMPLSFVIAGLVASYVMGYAVAIVIPLLSLIIMADAYYGKKSKRS